MTIAERVATRHQLARLDDPWLTQKDVSAVCKPCADRMASLNIREIRASALFGQDPRRLVFQVTAKKWQNLPKGWTDESLKKFWASLTGDVKHKVTACIKKMEGKMDNPGAFCAAANDRITGTTKWRGREALSRPSAKGNPAQMALSDAWDFWDEHFEKHVPGFLDDVTLIHSDELYGTPYMRTAETTAKGLKKAEVQSRSWRSGLNFWLEGRDIDTDRLAKDLDRTITNLQLTLRNLQKLGGIKREFPMVWEDVGTGYAEAVSDTETSIKMFETAVRLIRRG